MTASWLRRLLAFSGPGYLVSVGYMDPGNWATDLAGGSRVRLHAALGHPALQPDGDPAAGAVRRGSASSPAATSRRPAATAIPRPVNLALWVACELAIIACDLAEVIGTAIALQAAVRHPAARRRAASPRSTCSCCCCCMNRGFRYLEAFIIALLIVICGLLRGPDRRSPRRRSRRVLGGFVPSPEIVTNPAMLYIAIGILGATVMPHNLYLHSSIVQTRAFERNEPGKREAIRWATTDSTIALMLALFVNASILIVAAAAFHGTGRTEVAEIEDAYQLLSPLLGRRHRLDAVRGGAARLRPELDRHRDAGRPDRDGRLPAAAPAALGAAAGDARHRHRPGRDRDRALWRERHGAAAGAQPGDPVDAAALRGDPAGAVRVTDRKKMGDFVIPRPVAVLAWIVAGVIVALNIKLLFDTFVD